jgi:hypothetical protein
MELEQMIGFGMIYVIASACLFYTLGYNTGKKDGYLKGRIAGIHIGKQIERER